MAMAVALDTLSIVKKLKSAGVPEQQAEVLSEVLQNSREVSIDGLATKEDISMLKEDLLETKAELKTDIALLRGEMNMMKLMLGITLAGVFTLLAKAFAG